MSEQLICRLSSFMLFLRILELVLELDKKTSQTADIINEGVQGTVY